MYVPQTYVQNLSEIHVSSLNKYLSSLINLKQLYEEIITLQSLDQKIKTKKAKEFYKKWKNKFMDLNHFNIFKFCKPLSKKTQIRLVPYRNKEDIYEYLVMETERFNANYGYYFYPVCLVGVDTDSNKLFAIDVSNIVSLYDTYSNYNVRESLGFDYHIEEVNGIVEGKGRYRVQGEFVLNVHKIFDDLEKLIRYLVDLNYNTVIESLIYSLHQERKIFYNIATGYIYNNTIYYRTIIYVKRESIHDNSRSIIKLETPLYSDIIERLTNEQFIWNFPPDIVKELKAKAKYIAKKIKKDLVHEINEVFKTKMWENDLITYIKPSKYSYNISVTYKMKPSVYKWIRRKVESRYTKYDLYKEILNSIKEVKFSLDINGHRFTAIGYYISDIKPKMKYYDIDVGVWVIPNLGIHGNVYILKGSQICSVEHEEHGYKEFVLKPYAITRIEFIRRSRFDALHRERER